MLRSRGSMICERRRRFAEGPGPALPATQALELLALSEVITRKVRHGLQLSVRTARLAGASWADIGRSLGISRQAAWEAHMRWIDVQAAQHVEVETEGLDEEQVAQARAWAGTVAQ